MSEATERLIDLLPEIAREFISRNARIMNAILHCDYELASDAGSLAYLQSARDGEVLESGLPTRGGKRFIRREMQRASAPARLVKITSIPDYGYEDGRTAEENIETKRRDPKDKFSRRRKKLQDAGLCVRCGKPPENEYRLCAPCRIKQQNYNRESARRRRRGSALKSGASLSDQIKMSEFR